LLMFLSYPSRIVHKKVPKVGHQLPDRRAFFSTYAGSNQSPGSGT
jgi:hypothetical protein